MILYALRVTFFCILAIILHSSEVNSESNSNVHISDIAEEAIGFVLNVDSTTFMNILKKINDNVKLREDLCVHDYKFWTAVTSALLKTETDKKGDFLKDHYGEDVFCTRAIVKGSELNICVHESTFKREAELDDENEANNCELSKFKNQESGNNIGVTSRNSGETVVDLLLSICQNHPNEICADICCPPSEENNFLCYQQVKCFEI